MSVPQKAARPVVAWTVEVGGESCVVFATTRAKAQWIATRSYWEAFGRRTGVWPRAVAWRAHPYDLSPLRTGPNRAYSESYVMGV